MAKIHRKLKRNGGIPSGLHGSRGAKVERHNARGTVISWQNAMRSMVPFYIFTIHWLICWGSMLQHIPDIMANQPDTLQKIEFLAGERR